MRLASYPLSAINAFQVRTLRSLGFSTRVSLINKSNTDPKRATDYRVDVTAYDAQGRVIRTASDVARLEPGGFTQLECEPFTDGVTEDSLLTFHLVPLRLASGATDGMVGIDMGELMYLLTAQDQYVEYHRDDGYSSGVLYISAAMNMRSNPERTTMIQAPKIHIGPGVTTFMSLMNTSPDADYATVANMKCCLTTPDGRIAARWTEDVGPFRVMLVDLSRHVQPSDVARFYTFHGLCRNASLIPLTMNYDTRRHTLAVEHSLPPTYYGSAVKGAIRTGVIESLARSELFS